MIFPLNFGSLLFAPFFVFVWPRTCGSAALLYIVAAKFVRPELADGSAWPLYSQGDWGLRAMRKYLRLRLHVSEKLIARPAAQPVIIAIHPHGIAGDYRVAMDGMLYAALPGRTVLSLAASVLFSLPFVREVCLWTRCIDARKAVAARALRQGHSLLVIPGGEAEQMRTAPGVEEVGPYTCAYAYVRAMLGEGGGAGVAAPPPPKPRPPRPPPVLTPPPTPSAPCTPTTSLHLLRPLHPSTSLCKPPPPSLQVYLAKRAGFVKLALQHSAALVPCYAFGAVDLYGVTPAQHRSNSQGARWALSKKYGVAVPSYSGTFGFMPTRVPNDLILGDPLELRCAKSGEPTDGEVQAAHALYIEALRKLFDSHKAAFGYGDRQLVVT